jgi:hypothetical protein
MTSDAETALRFVERFAASALSSLEELLAEDLEFRGPLVQVHTRRAYLDALEADALPPTPFRILSVTEDSRGQVAIFWEYLKPDQPTTIGQ